MMTDWADETALELKRLGHLGAKPVAAALRKAKADGMREAALIAAKSKIITHDVMLQNTEQMKEWCRDPTPQEIATAIEAAASKLDSTD